MFVEYTKITPNIDLWCMGIIQLLIGKDEGKILQNECILIGKLQHFVQGRVLLFGVEMWFDSWSFTMRIVNLRLNSVGFENDLFEKD